MTGEQRLAFEPLRALAAPLRARVTADPEGWPIIPGRLGQVECVPGSQDLAVYTSGRLVPGMLLKIPGVRRHQTGDGEARLLFPVAVLPKVAARIRARKRRILSPDAARNLGPGTAYRATLGAKDGPLTTDPVVPLAEADLERSLRTETRLADDAPDPA